MQKCHHCGHNNLNDFKYCEKCGLKLNATLICPFCNTQNDTRNTSCKNCGKSFNYNTSQTNIKNTNIHYHPTTSNKLNLKALLVGSISIIMSSILFVSIFYNLYDNNYITYSRATVLTMISIVLSGMTGMIIFNKINHEKNHPVNIILVSTLSIIIFLIITYLIGTSGYISEDIILFFILIIIGSFIGGYI